MAIEITWTNNDDSSDGGISIDRSSDSGSTWTTIASGLSVSTTSYTDNPSGSDSYRYRVIRDTAHTTAISAETSDVQNTLPVTIDGTQVLEITIDGTAVQSITIDGDIIF